jgi:hypothetical protein
MPIQAATRNHKMKRTPCLGMLAAILLSAAMLVSARLRPATAATPAASEPAADSAAVKWVDVETGKGLFTTRDIVRFDWDRQLFELTRERAMDLMSLAPALQRDFIVRDAEGDIYRGCFMSSASSFSYDGPTIMTDVLRGMPGLAPPLYQITEGYGEHRSGAKRRLNPRLRERLQAAGALRNIDKDEKTEPIRTIFEGWHGQALGRRAATMLFPETVRIGRDIRLVLRFAETRSSAARSPAEREREARSGSRRDFGLSPEPDQVEARITLRSGDGKSKRTKTFAVPVANLAKGFLTALPVAMWPWSESGRSLDRQFKPGPAELAVSIVATKKTEKGIEQVGVWEIPVTQVQILPMATY